VSSVLPSLQEPAKENRQRNRSPHQEKETESNFGTGNHKTPSPKEREKSNVDQEVCRLGLKSALGESW
jgi:hypothetical protein